jgi:D-alanyl-D-alanine carboxypeptidase
VIARLAAAGLALWLALGLTAPPARAQPPAQPAGPISARAAIVVDGRSGRTLFARHAHERLPPASLTKMVTALVALQRAPSERSVSATVHSLVEPTVIGMEPGDSLPLGAALHGLLLSSGNDAALAIAESLGEGSIPRFVGWMNSLTESLGLESSHFANPHGLDEEEHYSSAYDLAVIGRALLRHPVLREMVGEQRYEFEGPPRWVFRNTNPLLGSYPGLDGIKTGYETRAGRCLAASASRDGRQVIVVLLNSARPASEAATLLDYGFDRQREGEEAHRASARLRRPPNGLVAGLEARVPSPSDRGHLPGLRSGPWLPRDPALPLAAGSRSVYELLRGAATSPGDPP